MHLNTMFKLFMFVGQAHIEETIKEETSSTTKKTESQPKSNRALAHCIIMITPLCASLHSMLISRCSSKGKVMRLPA